MLTMTGIRRPDVDDGFIGLGTRVRYHHRACEMRLPQPKSGERKGWESWVECGIGVKGNQPFRSPFGFVLDREDERQPFHAEPGVNKTIAVWPEEGEGVVIALIRKGIGRSYEGYQSGYEYPEWEPGGFNAKQWVWLYVVKFSMTGMNDLTLVPMDALRPVQ